MVDVANEIYFSKSISFNYSLYYFFYVKDLCFSIFFLFSLTEVDLNLNLNIILCSVNSALE